MTSELQRYPDVDFIGGSKDYRSTACLSYTAGVGAQFYIHFTVKSSTMRITHTLTENNPYLNRGVGVDRKVASNIAFYL
jgi:hypothetical protein